MQWFYDGQIKRYITQLVRMFSGFKYQDGTGRQVTVPILYGDLTRQVGAILRDNSENRVPSAPRMAIYLTRLELAKDRLADSTFVSKTHVRERAVSADGTEYLNTEGRNYTVEKLMPTPYTMAVNVDIWSTNTDQKLQILEQILMLFNPSLELQTTDNYIDWASVSVVYLDDINWSSRTIPSGTESEIDVATLGFSLPIYVSPPVKVKRLGVITDIITRIQDNVDSMEDTEPTIDISTGFEVDDAGNVISTETKVTESYPVNTGADHDDSTRNDSTRADSTSYTDSTNYPDSTNYTDSSELVPGAPQPAYSNVIHTIKINYRDTSLVISQNTGKIVHANGSGYGSWTTFLMKFGRPFHPNVTQVRLKRSDWPYEIVGLIDLDQSDNRVIHISWDLDTFPEDTHIMGPFGNKTKIDYIIDPRRTNPQQFDLDQRPRILILNGIGDEINVDGADAWKSVHGEDFIANANDIIEWDGEQWIVVYDSVNHLCVYSNEVIETVYVSNLNTGVQYKFMNNEWLLSIDGDYPPGSWRIIF